MMTSGARDRSNIWIVLCQVSDLTIYIYNQAYPTPQASHMFRQVI